MTLVVTSGVTWLITKTYFKKTSQDLEKLNRKIQEDEAKQVGEKPPEPDTEADREAHRIKAQAESEGRTIPELAAAMDPEVAWRLAIHAVEEEEPEHAQSILQAALERHPKHPKLLITAGGLWRRLGKPDEGLRYTEKAIEASTGDDDFEEQFYLANSNLCYQLALKGIEKVRALESGELAATNAHRFDDRDSFRINFGFAKVRFAESAGDLEQATQYLIGILHDQEATLTTPERQEIHDYLHLATTQLTRMGDR